MKLLNSAPGLALALLLASPAQAKSVDATLCNENLEGSYTGQMAALGAVRLNLMCVDGQHSVASFADQAATVLISLPVVAVDGDQLVASAVDLHPEERKEISSKSQLPYLKVDLSSLRAGSPKGWIFAGNAKTLRPFALHKEQSFPQMNSARRDLPKRALQGTFKVSSGAGSAASSGSLLADLLFDTPFLSIELGTGESRHLVDSPKWDGSGILSAATAAGEGEPDGKKLLYLRGRLLDEHSLEFYLVTPAQGLMGPFKGTRL